MDFSRVGAVEAAHGSFRARVQWKEDGQQRQCRGPCRDYEQTAQEDLESLRETAVTGGAALREVLLLYPFGIKEGPNCVSLAMDPLVGFVSQAQRYVSKEQRVLSDAPSG